MKQQTYLFIFCFIAFPFLHSCLSNNTQEKKGNYEIVHEKIEISDYEEIQSMIPVEIIYQQIAQDEPFLQVSVDKNIFPYLSFAVEGKKLIINQINDTTLKPSQLTIYTNSKNLCKIDLAGNGSVFLKKEVNAQNMEILISGAGNVSADSLYCENININISGTGEADLKGASTNARFEVNGVGTINAFDYFVNSLECVINGVGNADVYVNEKLNVVVAGVGDINYKGEPQTITKEISGTGNVSKI